MCFSRFVFLTLGYTPRISDVKLVVLFILASLEPTVTCPSPKNNRVIDKNTMNEEESEDKKLMSQQQDHEIEDRLESRIINRGKNRASRTDSTSLDSGVAEVKEALLHHSSSMPFSRSRHQQQDHRHEDQIALQEHVISATEGVAAVETASCSGSSSGLGVETTAERRSDYGARSHLGSDRVRDSNDLGGRVKLKREITLLNGTALVVGTIIGSGIFVSPKGVFENAGCSVSFALLFWSLCGLFSGLGSLCFSELGTTITRSGGEYSYVLEAFGPFAAFNNLWIQLLVIRPTTQAISALTFANYITSPFMDCSSPLLLRLVAASCICKSNAILGSSASNVFPRILAYL